MQSVRHLALGVCILCAGAGMIRIFWPETTFKPVINAVLLLYIIASALPVALAADWQGLAAELCRTAAPQTSDSAAVYEAYQKRLGLQASAEAIETILENHEIAATVSLQDGVCVVELVQGEDETAAQALLKQYSGSMPYRILAEKAEGSETE